MRLPVYIYLTLLAFSLSPTLWAKSEPFNEMNVEKLSGTIMVNHQDGSKPTALQTGSTVEKGDVVTVYDGSWVILKTHKGDRIGLQGNTVLTVDEYYIEGPDRQIRFLLQKGTILLRTNGCGSRQSFFEINSGSVVTSINDTHTILTYDATKEHLRAQHLDGKLSVIDKDNEQKFTENHTEHNWNNGKMAEEEAIPVDEVDVVNFNRFFNAEPLLEPQDNNLLLR